jgi:ligand-binding sensor domain-containing protein
MKNKTTTNRISLITVLLVIVLACNNHPESIPLTEETNIGQPVTVPFKFTEVKQLKWPVNSRPLRSQIKKIDFDKIPEIPFDSLGFMPFTKQPDEVPFDLDKLPDSTFNYNDLPSKTFNFKISVLEPPIPIKANLHLKSGTHELLYEFGEPFTSKSDKALFEDKNGFTWIGTDQGLYRYDGQNLLLYRQVPSASTFTEDNNGQIWIALANGNGICIIDTRSNILKRLTTANGLTSNNVARMVTDLQNRVWAVINPVGDKDHMGLNIIDENNKSIKWFDQDTFSNNNGNIRVFVDKQNNIWDVNILGGIKIIDLKNGRLRFLNKNSGLLSDTAMRMFQDENNRIWVAEIGRINAIDMKRKTITHYDLGRLSVTPIVSDDQGNIWIGTNNGLGNNNDGIKIIDPIRKLLKTLNKASGLSSNDIGRLLKDEL